MNRRLQKIIDESESISKIALHLSKDMYLNKGMLSFDAMFYGFLPENRMINTDTYTSNK